MTALQVPPVLDTLVTHIRTTYPSGDATFALLAVLLLVFALVDRRYTVLVVLAWLLTAVLVAVWLVPPFKAEWGVSAGLGVLIAAMVSRGGRRKPKAKK